MSSILKALKKLEEEKLLHEESAGINLSREILKQNSGNRNIHRWLWLFVSSATVVIIILSAALLRTSAPKNAAKPGERATITPQPALPALPGEKLPAASPATGRSKEIGSPAPLAANETKLKPPRQNIDQQTETPLRREAAPPATTATPVAPAPKPDPVVKAAPLRPPAVIEQTLSLSGIAWNKDSADRLAIINGQPTATGATVNGVVIEEILQDRVKLSHKGKSFELLIGRDARID